MGATRRFRHGTILAMHQLILLRHAKAEPERASLTDHERALTGEGRQAASRIGQAMRKAGLAPEVVLVSPAQRTQATLAALEETPVWDEWPNIETMPQLYMATPSQILQSLRDLPETVRSALIIGHNPGLHELALLLADPARANAPIARIDEGFPTAALAELLVPGPWRLLRPGQASLTRFLLPADVSDAR